MRLTKHHGLGNDFLVLLHDSPDGPLPVDGDAARALCARRTGIGADGLVVGTAWMGAPTASGDGREADLAMVLWNADGSRAEMSGNGIRCLAQAVARDRGATDLDLAILTDAGVRATQVRPGESPSSVVACVDMGEARPGPAVPAEPTASSYGKATTVDLGNPHVVVLVDDPEAVDLEVEGAAIAEQVPGGANVEFVAPTAVADQLAMTVWERGAGITEACGTGACAAAHAAHEWGLVGTEVVVSMPGGDATVGVGPPLTLEGPATYVATVDV